MMGDGRTKGGVKSEEDEEVETLDSEKCRQSVSLREERSRWTGFERGGQQWVGGGREGGSPKASSLPYSKFYYPFYSSRAAHNVPPPVN